MEELKKLKEYISNSISSMESIRKNPHHTPDYNIALTAKIEYGTEILCRIKEIEENDS